MLVDAGRGTAEQSFRYDRAFGRLRQTAYSEPFRQQLDGWNADVLYTDVWNRAVGEDDVDRALYGDLVTYLPDQLLVKMDVSTMAHSVEARSPLLDTSLVEFAATIPTSLRLKRLTTKYLLKRLGQRYVPRDVLYRRKRGFVMPLRKWLCGSLRPHLLAALASDPFADRGWLEASFVRRMLDQQMQGSHDWSQQLWTLFVLELWCRMFIDRTLGRSDSLDAIQ